MTYLFSRVVNNNAIVAYKPNNEEVILLGKGIGVSWKKSKGTAVPEHLIEKVFVVDKSVEFPYVEELLKNIPFSYVQLVEDVMEQASKQLEYDFKDTLFLTLLDHISFAKSRWDNNEVIINPLLNEIKQFHQKEFAVAADVIKMINKNLKTSFDENEVAFIAFHFINAMSVTSQHDTIQRTRILKEVQELIENYFNIKLDEQSMYYTRFITHLKYLLSRILNNSDHKNRPKEGSDSDTQLSELICSRYKNEWRCAEEIMRFLKENYQITSTAEELSYLTLHIVTLLTKALKTKGGKR